MNITNTQSKILSPNDAINFEEKTVGSWLPLLNNIFRDVAEMNHFVHREHKFGDEVKMRNQLSYTTSEMDELLYAVKDKSTVEMMDAIGDVFVTASYFLFLAQGEQRFKEKMNSIVKQPLASLYNPDILATNENLKRKLKTIMAAVEEHSVDFVQNTIDEAMEDLFSLIVSCNYFKEADGSIDLTEFQIVDQNYWSAFEVAAFEISNSNFSKFPIYQESSEGEAVIQENIDHIVKTMKDKTGEIINVNYKINDGKVVYYNTATNKFLKPKSFQEPNLNIFVDVSHLVKLCDFLYNEHFTN